MPRVDRVRLFAEAGLVTVRATLNGVADFVLVVDTGAARTILSRKAATRLDLDLLSPLREERLVGVGQSPPVPVIWLDRIQVGIEMVEGLEVSIFDLPPAIQADGLLGLSFLRRFRITFDFDAGMLILRDPRTR